MKSICIYILLFVMSVTILFSKAQKFRPDYMWAQSFKTFYRLHDLATKWHQAKQICEAEGTSLLVPDSLDEMENLKLLVSNMKSHFTAIFVGLHDQFSNGIFVNLKGEPIKGTTLEYLWGEGLPDSHNFSEHCVVMTREGLFDDKPCDDIYPFVCKIHVNNIVVNEECDTFELGFLEMVACDQSAIFVGYKPNGKGKCYHFHDEPLNWHDAYLVCKSKEGDLAVINSPEEATMVTKFLSDHINLIAPNPDILLLGFSDLLFPFQYRTIHGQTLEEAGYASWSPEMETVPISESKHCGAISRTGFLEMVACDQSAIFVCEKPAAVSVIPELPTTPRLDE